VTNSAYEHPTDGRTWIMREVFEWSGDVCIDQYLTVVEIIDPEE
jgi:hypothetical protein